MLEFNCPYCTAEIRVGLEAAGKVGRCPKCQTRIRVPELTDIPKSDAAATPSVPPMETLADEVLVESRTPLPDIPSPVGSVLPAPSIAQPAGWTPPVDPASPLERLREKRRKGSPYAALIPPLFFGAIFLVIGVVYWIWSQPSYEGTMTGTVVISSYALATDLAGQSYGAPPQPFKSLMQELFQRPVDLRSSLINLRYMSDGQNLRILIRPGVDTKLVQVPLGDNKSVAKFYRNHQDELDGYRLDEMQGALKKLCADWTTASEAGRELETLPKYRETIALNAHVSGLGRICEAIVGNERYPCVEEDAAGRLMFLVPVETKSFNIRERPAADLGHARLFPSTLDIHVKVVIPAERVVPAAAPASAPQSTIPYAGEEPGQESSLDSTTTEMPLPEGAMPSKQ